MFSLKSVTGDSKPLFSALLCLFVLACGSVVHEDESDAGQESDAAAELTIALSPSSFLVAPGDTAAVAVTVSRPPGVGAVEITVTDLAGKLEAAPLAIAADADTGTLLLAAAPSAAQGEVLVSLEANAGDLEASATAIGIVSGAAGTLDLGFATNGIFRGPVGSRARALARSGDGFVVVGDSAGQLLIARFLDDGSLDGSFGADGTVVSAFANGASGRAVAIDGAGGIVVAGATFDVGGAEQPTLFRYTDAGDLDLDFGDDGIAILTAGGASGPLISVHVGGPAGYLAGLADPPSLVRFSANGDTISNLGVASPNSTAGLAATLVESGGVITVARGSGNALVTARRTPEGLDTTFSETVSGLTGQPNGLVAVEGGYVVGGIGSAALFLRKLRADGTTDSSFGSDGELANVAAVVAPSDATNNMAVDSQSRLLFGAKQRVSGGNVVVVRILSSGLVDESFGGSLASDQGGGTIAGIVVDDLGRVVAVGDADGQLILGRLWP